MLVALIVLLLRLRCCSRGWQVWKCMSFINLDVEFWMVEHVLVG